MSATEFSRDAWSKVAHCLTCGAMVQDEKRHTAWHDSLTNVLVMIAEATQ